LEQQLNWLAEARTYWLVKGIDVSEVERRIQQLDAAATVIFGKKDFLYVNCNFSLISPNFSPPPTFSSNNQLANCYEF